MIWFFIMQVFSTLLDLARLKRQTDQEKDLEILLLRHQLAILERKLNGPLRISRVEKFTLAVLAARLRSITNCPIKRMANVIRLFQPETVFRWHRELVRRKWTFRRQSRGGRPRITLDFEGLVVCLARENTDWATARLKGNCGNWVYSIHEDTIARILKRHGIPPSLQRKRSPSWQQLMNHYWDQLLACDFFVVETLFLKTLYVLVFIEIGSRRVHLAACTDHPDRLWVPQQARQVLWNFEDRQPAIHFLIRDNDGKFAPSFDTVFKAEHIHIILTPFHAPNANAFTERWVRSVREECLDKLLIINQTHLQHILRDYIHDYYHEAA